MKTKLFFTLIICFFTLNVFAQEEAAKATEVKSGVIPSVTIKNLEGVEIDAATLSNDGKPVIVSFWATWCKPCVKELNAINEVYEEWQEETGVKLIAISIDDARTSSEVVPMVDTEGWEYEVYLDENGDLRRAMNVVMVPHTFLIDGKGNLVAQHTSYAPGDEEELYKKVVKLSETATEPVSTKPGKKSSFKVKKTEKDSKE